MDDLDKKILDAIQTGFPLHPRPYAELGRRFALTEAEALARVRALRGSGIIRRIGPNFTPAGLGWTSTLCAAKVPPERLEPFVAEVNRHPGVTHNYRRDHAYNIWFTLIGPSREQIEEDIRRLSAATGIDILDLPAVRTFKLRVDFRLEE